MDETPLFLAKEYHREILDVASKVQSTKGLSYTLPTTRDRISLRIGNSLIRIGERMKNNATPSVVVKLAEDCA